MRELSEIPVQRILKNGYLFLWVINCQLEQAFKLLEVWDLIYVDQIAWVKTDSAGNLQSSNAHYFRRHKEHLLVARTRAYPPVAEASVLNELPDIIVEPFTGINRKPNGIYPHIEKFVPKGKYLELFARPNNLRPNWCSVGSELLNQGGI